MSEPKLGEIIPDGLPAERDAIHIAVAPLIAGRRLYRGCSVRLAFGSNTIAVDCEEEDPNIIGIVDPFLKDYQVSEGDRFWCFLTPGTVTGMRHQWQHPKFDNVQLPKDEHENWLRCFCDRWNFDYDELIEAGTGISEDEYGRYVVAHGIDLHSRGELGDDYRLFWEHLQGLTGKEFDEKHRNGMGWSCSC